MMMNMEKKIREEEEDDGEEDGGEAEMATKSKNL